MQVARFLLMEKLYNFGTIKRKLEANLKRCIYMHESILCSFAMYIYIIGCVPFAFVRIDVCPLPCTK
jgi:hypothetical protein